MFSLGFLHTLGLLLPFGLIRCVEPDRTSFLPRSDDDTRMAVSGGLGGSGDGMGRSNNLGPPLKHLSSIRSIHRFSLAVGDEAAVVEKSTFFGLKPPGERDRAHLSALMPAERSLRKTSRSDAGEMKYAKGSASMFSWKNVALDVRNGGQE